MRYYFNQIVFSLLLVLLFNQCAQVGQLTGGKKDTTPPALINATPANASINFNSSQIILQFDEFVQLKDLTNQLIITPSLKTLPEITSEGKKIKINLKREELKPNSTYHFSFGSSIADMHEGNTIKNFEYVFSTGNYIDTLKITGLLSDAFNNNPVPGALIALYTNFKTDSLPFTTTPEFIAKTEDNGMFQINYLPSTTYKVFAIADANKNMLYDGETEKIGFESKDLELKSDTNLSLKLFQEESKKVFLKKTLTPYYGLVQLILNRKIKSNTSPLQLSLKSLLYETQIGKEKDTIAIYHRNIGDSLSLIFNYAQSEKPDTLVIALPKDNNAKRKSRKYSTNIVNGKIPLNEDLKLQFPFIVDTAKTNYAGIRLSKTKDSLTTKVNATYKWLNEITLQIMTKYGTDEQFELRTDSATFYDFRGLKYDSAVSKYTSTHKNEFGKLTLKLLLNKKQNYLIQLLNEKDVVIAEQTIALSLSSSNAVSLDFIDLQPTTYKVKVIYDDNENKKWDTGNVMKKQQAEKVFISTKQIKVTADWEMEEEILIKE